MSPGALQSAISFLERCQGDDGGFRTEASSSRSLADATAVDSVYLHAFVVNALVTARTVDSRVEPMLEAAAAYIEQVRGDDGWWSFRTPPHDGPPADVDDTAVALAALLRIDDSIRSDAAAWVDSLEPLRSESGLMKTWADSTLNTLQFELPDSAVNANLLLLQGLTDRIDAVLVRFFSLMAEFRAYHALDLYFVRPLALPYLISRCLHDGRVDELAEIAGPMASHVEEVGWDDELDCALALVTLLNCGVEDGVASDAEAFLTARQLDDGGWASGALFLDFAPTYYGARAFTTALAVEALARSEAR